ncbi:SCP domain-containing protein [Caenorhabditis elegans]|uniref:SCP domain-containing protein n=1 Tax=Caenorhabditis elegans TaxID=6239 RepID=Q9N5N4_CAEEL|nr:SCP domain-containing protein [Caenorhabditis elegans]CCD71373.1 SCP domain-containing protein [Caenorhabditis elegans]|eukprot:NP_504055.1 SCP-Like extracellular protein [Caenorhabditis elegans]
MKFALCLLAIFGCATAQFSSTAQGQIVDAHNKLRSAIAQGSYVAAGTQEPSASNMRKIVWDETVAAAAQEYAEGCPDDHSGTSYGENLYWSWSSSAPSSLDKFGVAASNSWESEFQKYGWTSTFLDEAGFATGIGHATQMAWAETSKIGCGIKNCGKDANKKNMYKVAVVCQYDSAGNMMDSDIYQQGETCSACSEDASCEQDSGLCA